MQKKQKKEEKKKTKKKQHPKNGGPWKRAGSSSTIFFQKMGFFKILKNPIFIVFSEKMGGRHFVWKKAMLQGGHF